MENNNEVVQDVEKVQDISLSDESIKKIDEVLSKYFDTKEEKELKAKELQKEIEKEEKIQLDKEKESSLEEVTFQEQLVNDLTVLKDNTQLGNNLVYIASVLALLIFIYIVFYKFLKNFV